MAIIRRNDFIASAGDFSSLNCSSLCIETPLHRPVRLAFATLRRARFGQRVKDAVAAIVPRETFEWDGKISDDWTPEDWKSHDAAVNAALKQRDGRSLTIVSCAMIEDRLRWLIEAKFIPNLSTAKRNYIFSGTGPLSSLSAKIEIAYALGLLPEAFRDELKLINAIRNRFAHNFRHVRFSDPEIVKMCKQFEKYNEDQMNPSVRGSPMKRFGYHALIALVTIFSIGQVYYARSAAPNPSPEESS